MMLKQYAELCKDSYENPKVKIGNHQFTYKVINNELVIAFAGTNDIVDWLDNLNLLTKNGFHAGFYEIFELLQLPVENIINSYPNKIPLFVGHSLGASVAQIFAHQYKTSTICFSSPRIVPRWLKRSVNGSMLYLEGDIIPFLPRFTYKHPNGLNIIKIDSNLNALDAHKIENLLLTL